MSEKKPRKPALTHRAMMNLLAVSSMAQADAESMDGNSPNDTQHASELMAGCEWIRRLASYWAASRGVAWPTEYKPKGGGR